MGKLYLLPFYRFSADKDLHNFRHAFVPCSGQLRMLRAGLLHASNDDDETRQCGGGAT